MDRCGFVPGPEIESDSPCPREPVDGHGRCPFHLAPEERRSAGISSDDLREAFLDDVRSDDDRRRRLLDARFREFDLSSLVVDGGDLGRIVLRGLTVRGTLDLSRVVVRHPLTIDACEVGHLRVADASFEASVTIGESTFGADGSGTCLTTRRATFEGGFDSTDTDFLGAVEFAAASVMGWFDLESVTVDGGAHFTRVSLEMAQFIDVTFRDVTTFTEADIDHIDLERIRLAGDLDLSGTRIERLRSTPAECVEVDLRSAVVERGRLDQPTSGSVRYDLTEATVGDVTLECDPGSLDRYRFYRTRFDGFPFAAYRDVLRANDWRLHDYVGEAEDDLDGLEITYLEARQGATAVGDHENAAAFFVREMDYRRGRYAAHAVDPGYSIAHRAGAAVRWATNAFLGVVSGYGERPHRTLLVALSVIVGAAAVYPAVGGLATGGGVSTYSGDGVDAFLEALYFSVVTFATLGLGDLEPAGPLGRLVAGTEALSGAFLTALFVFALGRRVAR